MSTQVATKPQQTPIQQMASRLSVDPQEMQDLVMNTLMTAKGGRGTVSNAELVTFLAIANEYRLNPLTKEIYAFNNRGAIQPIVSIDGWLSIINGHPQFDGMEFVDGVADGQLQSVTCRIYRKDRSRPTEVTEYMAECKGISEPWKKWPARMLRHKATIQGARYAFGLSGIIDEDEAERYKSTNLEREVNPAPQPEGISSLKNAISGKPELQPEQKQAVQVSWSDEQEANYKDVVGKMKLAQSQAELSATANDLAQLGELPDGYRDSAMQAYRSRKAELDAAR